LIAHVVALLKMVPQVGHGTPPIPVEEKYVDEFSPK
jgi:hypothetical protein